MTACWPAGKKAWLTGRRPYHAWLAGVISAACAGAINATHVLLSPLWLHCRSSPAAAAIIVHRKQSAYRRCAENVPGEMLTREISRGKVESAAAGLDAVLAFLAEQKNLLPRDISSRGYGGGSPVA